MDTLNQVTKRIHQQAETLYIEHQASSFAIICFNQMGDVFINSDWGFFAYAWRSMGNGWETKRFLATCNKEYLAKKLWMNTSVSKKAEKATMPHLMNYCEELIKHCKQDVTNDSSNNQ